MLVNKTEFYSNKDDVHNINHGIDGDNDDLNQTMEEPKMDDAESLLIYVYQKPSYLLIKLMIY